MTFCGAKRKHTCYENTIYLHSAVLPEFSFAVRPEVIMRFLQTPLLKRIVVFIVTLLRPQFQFRSLDKQVVFCEHNSNRNYYRRKPIPQKKHYHGNTFIWIQLEDPLVPLFNSRVRKWYLDTKPAEKCYIRIGSRTLIQTISHESFRRRPSFYSCRRQISSRCWTCPHLLAHNLGNHEEWCDCCVSMWSHSWCQLHRLRRVWHPKR